MVAEVIVAQVSKGVVTALVKPLVEGAMAGIKAIKQDIIDGFTNKFATYLESQVERHAYLNTLVFGTHKALDDLYIPLTVIPSVDGVVNEEKGVLLNSFKNEFIGEHKRVLITDTAGMGKSTLMKFLFLQCIKSKRAVPIFVELRHLSQNRTLLDLIEQQVNPTTAKDEASYFNRKDLQRVLKLGGIIFFFDGYDEIPFKDREQVTTDLKNFIENFSKNAFAITSRPETGLAAFPSFNQYTIRPLKKEESFALIKKYDKDGVKSQQLIERLKGKEYRGVTEFLKNPLLTTLLYRCYEYKQSLPLKKHVFYRQVFDALFDWHDASKDGYNTREKKSKLDIDSFHRVLRVLGIISVMKGEIEGDKDTVLEWIRNAKILCEGISFSESDFLDDMVRAVPVFVKDGAYYRWSHKSLAEYFAAQYVCSEGKPIQETIFPSMWEGNQIYRFSNVLDQIYDLDISAFRKYFILPVAHEFSNYWGSSYLEFSGDMSIENVRLRKLACFGMKYVLSSRVDDLTFDNIINEALDPDMEKNGSESTEVRDLPLSIAINLQGGTGKGTGYPIFVFSFKRPVSVILNILEDKKDPLIQNKSKIDLSAYKTEIAKSATKKPIEVTDAINNALNSKRNFNSITKLIVSNDACVLVDAERMLGFEATLQDGTRVNEFANNLLSSSRNKKVGKINK
jgi:hypothetical protein